MLAGVGGKTVAEAKATISYSEFLDWVAYAKQYGPIAPQEIARMQTDFAEWNSAKIAWSVFKAAGAKSVKISDFIPKKEEVREEKKATPEIGHVFGMLQSVTRKKK